MAYRIIDNDIELAGLLKKTKEVIPSEGSLDIKLSTGQLLTLAIVTDDFGYFLEFTLFEEM